MHPAPATSQLPPAQRAKWSLSTGWQRALMTLALAVMGLDLLLLYFPWNWLREPLNRWVTERTGRHFAITGHLDVKLGRVSTVVLDGIEFAYPSWAREPWLLKAQGGEFQVALWPLLRGQLVLPMVSLRQPEWGLQLMPDGRRTWALDKQQQSVPGARLGDLVVDRGMLHFWAPGQRIDLTAEVALAAAPDSPMPLSFKGQGLWRGQAFSAQGRTVGVLRFAQDSRATFPLDIQARAGTTRLQAQGRITHLAELAGMDMRIDLEGQSLADLFGIVALALPASPPYRVQGQLHKQGQRWQLKALQGQLGRSDVQGELTLERRPDLPLLSGQLHSEQLDLADLGPAIGLPASGRRAASPRSWPSSGRVLPTQALDFSRLRTLEVDVAYSAARVRHAPWLPFDSLKTRVTLQGARLRLDPLELAVAGGQVAGVLVIDARPQPAAVELQLQARQLQLQRLLPTVQATRSSLGALSGRVVLQGRGQSVAALLGSSSGELNLLMGQGRISNILLEFMGLDGAEIVKFLVRGDQNIRLRCAAVAFDVRQGQLDSRVILLDTVDTVVRGQGRISLSQETLDLVLHPQPKDTSIFSLRSPLRVTGTLAAPVVGPDKVALAGRLGLTLALAALNPLLALAATIETGPGEDAHCAQVLSKAAADKGSAQARQPLAK
jgi:AsmA family protein